MRVLAAYTYDAESRNWCFRVPSLGIIGGADTREEAEQDAIDAIAYALEDETEGAELGNDEVRYLALVMQR